jgi:hypothetical protein
LHRATPAEQCRSTGYRRLGPSLGLLLRCGCGQQLGYAPFTSLAEVGQVLRRTTTDTCGSWNPWDPNYPHQGPHESNVDGVQQRSPPVMVVKTRVMLAAPLERCSR